MSTPAVPSGPKPAQDFASEFRDPSRLVIRDPLALPGPAKIVETLTGAVASDTRRSISSALQHGQPPYADEFVELAGKAERFVHVVRGYTVDLGVVAAARDFADLPAIARSALKQGVSAALTGMEVLDVKVQYDRADEGDSAAWIYAYVRDPVYASSRSAEIALPISDDLRQPPATNTKRAGRLARAWEAFWR